MPASSLSILTYHSLDDDGSVISIAPSLFREQMEWLRAHDYHNLSLVEATRLLSAGKGVPDKSFVITFDDGYENLYPHAFPVLEQFGWGATVFLITDFCGKSNDWPGHAASVRRQPLLSWSQIEEMARHTFNFGAHTKTHPDLTRIPIEQVEREVGESKVVLEDRLGTAVHTFAYPYGKFNAPVREVARQHFQATCSTRLGKAKYGCDLQTLQRIDVYYLRDLKMLARIEGSTFDLYLQFRQGLRDVKGFLKRD